VLAFARFIASPRKNSIKAYRRRWSQRPVAYFRRETAHHAMRAVVLLIASQRAELATLWLVTGVFYAVAAASTALLSRTARRQPERFDWSSAAAEPSEEALARRIRQRLLLAPLQLAFLSAWCYGWRHLLVGLLPSASAG
jgi:hypothetical protein